MECSGNKGEHFVGSCNSSLALTASNCGSLPQAWQCQQTQTKQTEEPSSMRHHPIRHRAAAAMTTASSYCGRPLFAAVLSLLGVSCALSWVAFKGGITTPYLLSTTGTEPFAARLNVATEIQHRSSFVSPFASTEATRPTTTTAKGRRGRQHVTQLHIQGVLLGDSMLTYTDFTTSKLRFKVDDFLSEVLQKSLRGAMMRRTVVEVEVVPSPNTTRSDTDFTSINHTTKNNSQSARRQLRQSHWSFASDAALQSVTSYWADILNDSDRLLDETTWASVVQQSHTMLQMTVMNHTQAPSQRHQPPTRQATTTEYALIRSAAASTFTTPGASTHQFAEAAQQCLTGTLNLTTFLYHASCFAFLTSLESGLKAAARNGAEEVVFLIFTAVGINNMNLDPLSWVPVTEVERVMSVMRTAVRVLVGDVGNTSGNKEHRTQGGASVRQLLEQSFRGKRHATVVASSVPGALFFNNATVPSSGTPTVISSYAWKDVGHRDQQPLRVVNKPTVVRQSLPASYAPASTFCNKHHVSSNVERNSCHWVCSLFTASYHQRRAGFMSTLRYEAELQAAMHTWAHTNTAKQQQQIAHTNVQQQQHHLRSLIKVDVVPSLVPLRRATLGHCGQNTSSSSSDVMNARECLAAHPHTMNNFRDCVHLSTVGARRFALSVVDTWLRHRATLLLLQ